jgi:hypothetical protein
LGHWRQSSGERPSVTGGNRRASDLRSLAAIVDH